MLDFNVLEVDESIKKRLLQFNIDFAFQPIYTRDGEIFGREALMRPEGITVLDFIAEMEKKNMLHELELVSFFGATLAYKNRGYDKKLCINSFPSECFTIDEAKAYSECFKSIKQELVIEILEYTEGEKWKWRTKEAHTKAYDGIQISLDDFGSGKNDDSAVDFYHPHIIKLDRSMISFIDIMDEIQGNVINYIKTFHEQGILVLAEGVETKGEYNWLLEHDVDLFQGFYLARPQ